MSDRIGCRVGEDDMKKSDECSRKIAGLMELAERYGVKMKESSVGSIGFVGGVRRPKAKSLDDDNPAGSPKPSVNRGCRWPAGRLRICRSIVAQVRLLDEEKVVSQYGQPRR